jgi:hypothetical protein
VQRDYCMVVLAAQDWLEDPSFFYVGAWIVSGR